MNKTAGENSELSEVLFYHLERQPLEAVLPALLEKTIQRGWRAFVRSGSQERLEALDLSLWTYRDDSFLPHGVSGDGTEDLQPVLLSLDEAPKNDAEICFLVDGADTTAFSGYERIVFLFDGADDQAIATARSSWKAATAAGCSVTYWQQSSSGAWQKRA